HWCGDGREGNLFCLRSSDAEVILHTLARCAKDKTFPPRFDENVRYASMNLAALPKYGSLEFRAMRGVDHPKPIIQWASTLLNIREEAKKYDNPKQIIEAFSLQGPDNFTDNLVNKLDGVAEVNDKEGYKMLMEGMRNAQFVAYSTD